MRVFYLDPGLRDDIGHHANYCRYIAGEFRRRGIEVLVFGHQEVAQSLQAELDVAPHFRAYTYARYAVWHGARGWLTDCFSYCADFLTELVSGSTELATLKLPEISPSLKSELGASSYAHTYTHALGVWRNWRGWLTAFAKLTRISQEDLFRLPVPTRDDIVFVTSVGPVQLAAVTKWRRFIPSERRPMVVVESVVTGLQVQRSLDHLHIKMPDPRVDPTATLFWCVARKLPRSEGARFHFITFAPIATEMFKMILQYPTRTMPAPYHAIGPLRNRKGARPILVAILGHQRLEKGYDRLPEIIQALLHLPHDIRILVQCVDPRGPSKIQEALRAIAECSGRVVLEETPAGKVRWPQLLEMSDLILCPHRAEYYVAGFSTVAAEAIANGIPLIVPAGSAMEALLMAHGCAGAAFERFEPGSITETTGRVLEQFDHFATLAHQAALRWPRTDGSARFVEEVMSLASRH